MAQLVISTDPKAKAEYEIKGLQNVVNMGSQRLAYLEGVVKEGGVEGLSLEDATKQMEAMKVRLADHKARIAKLQSEL